MASETVTLRLATITIFDMNKRTMMMAVALYSFQNNHRMLRL